MTGARPWAAGVVHLLVPFLCAASVAAACTLYLYSVVSLWSTRKRHVVAVLLNCATRCMLIGSFMASALCLSDVPCDVILTLACACDMSDHCLRDISVFVFFHSLSISGVPCVFVTGLAPSRGLALPASCIVGGMLFELIFLSC